ncbi:putative membrane-bound dehydrogenase domain-containing protein [Algoriphagus faecimaris]|uniref:Putative membrane-bound dehydrogenase domain-containing protein n=1 Tax=Algoriphagus faecimaris TaxID=686796 RepID=A0A1G6PLU3_9BACT|nr:PVC-type heme-binding CxxCH protein [Algoriphagus faecimaris]SDC81153.1 putative membrane-bound dehydrogenase domain-containing protein [Algoriphagus faecimaris]
MNNPNFLKSIFLLFVLGVLSLVACSEKKSYLSMTEPRRVEILVLGHESEHHNSEKLMMYLSTPLFQKGINLTYTTDPNDLNTDKLQNYDGLMIYANHDEISSSQENALKDYVEGGKALIPIHSASFCFRNSDWYVEAVGGQFSTHGTGDFTAEIIDADHPIMEGINEFETWDETYVHTAVNPDMHILMERVDEEGREPYTWTREQGKGRIFYTAYGHNEKTWEKSEFQQLVANGILWAVGDQVNELLTAYNIPQPEFRDAEIPNYERRDPAPRYQLPLSPEESQKLVQVPVGFELELFASEPMIINPISMTWDERGRLFVIETTDYPNEVRQEGGSDKIKILEDTDGDGKADKVTIFADNLNIPTSITPINGGMLISMAPDFVFLKDTDGDDVADVREVIMTGWGKSDTHAGPSNLRYGFDNKIWGVLGYSGFNGEVSGQQFNFGQGVYRFDPSGENLEYLGNTSNNTWGLGFTEDFETFISTANGQHSVYFSMANKFVKRPIYQGSANTVHGIDSHYDMPHLTPFLRQVDWHGSYTAAAGHNFYTARSFPKEYWNRIAFVAEPTGRVLHNAIINPDGSGYSEKNGFNILASSDEWFSPVHAEVGPDGALWVADWYNFIIQHNPTPRGFENGAGNAYINPLRDAEHGRIYRLVYKGAQEAQEFDLSNNNNKELIAALKSDNMFWRLTAQRLIVENKKVELLPELYKLISNQEQDEIGLNPAAIHALWALHGLGALDGTNREAEMLVEKALRHPSASVRKNALRVLPKTPDAMKAILASNLLQDEDQHTRKEAFLAISEMPFSEDAAKSLYQLAADESNASDAYLPQAMFAAVLSHPTEFAKRTYSPANAGAEEDISLADRISRSLISEQYPLDQRNSILFPPEVAGKEIDLRMIISKAENPLAGVLVAQGNNTNGYSLYIYEDALHFAVAQDEKQTIISSTKNLPEEQFIIEASLKESGDMRLSINGNVIGTARTKGLFTDELRPQSVRVGRNDSRNVVGKYEGDWWFGGRLSNKSTLSLTKPGAELEESESTAATTTSANGSMIVKLGVIPHEMKFDKAEFTVKAGAQVTIDFENPDFMQHNLVIGQKGSMETIGNAADELARNPRGAEQNYVPQIPEVIIATALVDPEGRESLVFTAPTEPGEYPFVCTVPGHWRIMNGIMKVE